MALKPSSLSSLAREGMCKGLLYSARIHAPVCSACRQKVQNVSAWVDPMHMAYMLIFRCCNAQMETRIDWGVAEEMGPRELASLIPAILSVPDKDPPWLKEGRDSIAQYGKEDRKKDLDSLWETM